jgi:hypothetical protein
MKNLAVITLTALFLTSTINIFADDTKGAHSVSINIPEVALLDLEGGTAVVLEPTAPTEAGDAFTFTNATDQSTWVNYSSIVASGNTRTVSAAITTGTVPTGLALKVTAANAVAANGKGRLGTAQGQITLSATAQSIITGIGSCYTGNGQNSGSNLTYALELTSTDNYDELVQANTSITITYTLTEDN